MADERATVHPILAERASPSAFDSSYAISQAEVVALLEAARWAPSAGNSQPWAFIVAPRGDEVHARLVPHLAGSSTRWAPAASLLVGNLVRRFVEDTDLEYSEFALYDLGQAVAQMTIQAQAMGLAARQFRAFDRDALHEEFAVPAHWQLMSMTAFGVAGDAPGSAAPGDGDGGDARRRREVPDLVWPLSGY
jgi:nitroreductase